MIKKRLVEQMFESYKILLFLGHQIDENVTKGVPFSITDALPHIVDFT